MRMSRFMYSACVPPCFSNITELGSLQSSEYHGWFDWKQLPTIPRPQPGSMRSPSAITEIGWLTGRWLQSVRKETSTSADTIISDFWISTAP